MDWTRWEFDRFGFKLKSHWGWEETRVGHTEYTVYQTVFAIGRLRVHCFHRGDQDPDPHDHMWNFWTFPLVSYEEMVYAEPDKSYKYGLNTVTAFRLHYRHADHTHRVIGPSRGKGRVWTIVLVGKKRRAWGFLTEKGWIPWKKYVEGFR